MRLGGRLAGAIEVLADIEGRRRPVADALKDWGLAHRFAGSGDRAAIGNIVYDALRMKLSHAWLMDDDSAASLAYAVLLRQWGKSFAELTAEFDGDKFAPPRPTRKGSRPFFPVHFPTRRPIFRAMFPNGFNLPSKLPSGSVGSPRRRRSTSDRP